MIFAIKKIVQILLKQLRKVKEKFAFFCVEKQN
jgi:ribosome-associated translation inhibitor RaiA